MGTTVDADFETPDWGHSRYRLTGEVRPAALGIRFWSAHDLETDSDVMIKALRASEYGDVGAASFETEGRAVAALRHPAVLRLLDRGRAGDWLFHAYELADRRTLHDVLRSGPVSLEHALAFGVQLAEALQAVHEAGLPHGYVQPMNVLVGANLQLKLTGFATGWEWAHTFVPHYSAPEHVLRNERTPRGDLYMFGGVLWALLTGRPFVEGSSQAEVVAFHDAALTADLAAACPTCPRWLSRLVRRCLATHPEGRPLDAREVLDEFEGRTSRGASPPLLPGLERVRERPWIAPLPAILGDLELLRSPALAGLRLIDLCEASLKLAAVMALNDAPGPDLVLSDKPMLGHWQEALRGHSTRLAARVTKPLLHAFDQAVTRRNRFKGHGSLGDTTLYDSLLSKDAPRWLDALGSTRLFDDASWRDDRLVLAGEPLETHGLALREVCPVCARHEVFLFNGRARGRRTYLSYETGHLLEVT